MKKQEKIQTENLSNHERVAYKATNGLNEEIVRKISAENGAQSRARKVKYRPRQGSRSNVGLGQDKENTGNQKRNHQGFISPETL